MRYDEMFTNCVGMTYFDADMVVLVCAGCEESAPTSYDLITT